MRRREQTPERDDPALAGQDDDPSDLDLEPELPPRLPVDSRIEQQILPGQSLRLLLPPIGLGRDALVLIALIAAWCALLLYWHGRLGSAPAVVLQVFFLPQLAGLAALGLKLAWVLFGRVELCADARTFTRTRRLFGLRRRRSFPTRQVEALSYQLKARAIGPQDERFLFLVVAGKSRLLAEHLSHEVFLWARHELAGFLDSLALPPYNPPND